MARKTTATNTSPQDSYATSSIYSDKTGFISDTLTPHDNDVNLSVNRPGADFMPNGAMHIISPEEEYLFWESNYVNRDYIDRSLDFNTHYAPAYRYGIESYSHYEGQPYEDIDESSLKSGWEKFAHKSELAWDKVKHAVKDAYDRMFENDENTTEKW